MITDLNPSPRLLLGPGPSPVHPRVLRAMSTPLIGYLDPEWLALMDEEQELLRQVFQTKNALTLPLSGTGMTGMEAAMANFGMHLGTAFQLIDDVLDYSGDHTTTGKNIGDDLAEGKTTLPLIYAMKHGAAEQVQLVRRAIECGGLEELSSVLEAIRSSGALEYARAQAQAEAHTACAALDVLPNSKYRDYLLQLADFAVTRTF